MRRRGRIDPAAHEPIYHQLADILREGIRAGEYPPGSLLPNQVRLAQEHELGVDTVRDALAVLRREGLIVTTRGQGSRVRPVEEVSVRYVPPDAEISARMPTETERRGLGLPEGVPVLVVSCEGQPDEVLPANENVVRYQED
jgi:DNA-binding GntR family transcriptional regulator